MIYSKRGEEEWDRIQEENQKRWNKEYELKKKGKYQCQICECKFEKEEELNECIKEHQKTIIYLKEQVKSYENIFEKAVLESLLNKK